MFYNVCFIIIVRQQIHQSVKEHYTDLKQATQHCIPTISDHLYSKHFISHSVHETPTFDRMIAEFESGLLSKDLSQMESYCIEFIECLSSSDGPSVEVSSRLAEKWKHFFHDVGKPSGQASGICNNYN